MSSEIHDALNRLQSYIEASHYRGYDPYDALKSPLFKLPFFRTSKWIRFAAQQAVKRSPVNLRPLLFVPKGYNPVTLGLCLQAYTRLLPLDNSNESLNKCHFLVSELEKLAAAGFHGACWGYDFDWEARHAKIPAHQPTVVATGIIANALFLYWQASGNQRASDLCASACQFVLKDLQRTLFGDTFCFSYSPFDRQCVYNASMKAVRILAQGYKITGDESLKAEAFKAAAFVASRQRSDGSWQYSEATSGRRVDNYHTGYVLDCLLAYEDCTGDPSFDETMKRGWHFYRAHFFQEGMPAFLSDSLYPIDSTAAAQSLLTLCRFGDVEKAREVAKWMIGNMQDEKGYFYFRHYKNRIVKTPFMRWSNAWMFAGLAETVNRMEK